MSLGGTLGFGLVDSRQAIHGGKGAYGKVDCRPMRPLLATCTAGLLAVFPLNGEGVTTSHLVREGASVSSCAYQAIAQTAG